MSDSTLLPYEEVAIDIAEKGYSILDGFFSNEEVAAVLKVLDHQREDGEFKKAGIGSGADYQQLHGLRGDFIHWIEPASASAPVKVFLDRVTELMGALNQVCYLGLKDFETHFTFYPAGSRYARHLDQFKGDGHRRISFICYLNMDWKPGDGGELRMFLPDGNGQEQGLDIQPLAGRLACFRADTVEHEVLLAHKTRYSLTGWMLDQHHGLRFL